MKNILIIASLGLFVQGAQAQDQKAAQKVQPQMTEFWTPQPKVVASGDIKTLSAPSDALILFDGKDLNQWVGDDGQPAQWDVHNGIVTVNKKKGSIHTKEKFGNFQLHLEWCTPKDIQGEGQMRGNSGVYLQERYELQILDSYKNDTYTNGMVGAIYKQAVPLANPMRKPGEWNTYDIIYTAPVFKEDGTYLYRPRVTVLLNNVLVQNNTEILGATAYSLPKVEKHGDDGIQLQAHGDESKPISFRNIWIRKL